MTQFETVKRPGSAVTSAWVRALELTASIARQPNRILPHVIAERAEELRDAPALLSNHQCLTYRELHHRVNQYARWALEQGVSRRDCVCLMMPNSPEYLAIWLGISSVGGVVSLLNTSLTGSSLAHCINIVSPRHLIVSSEFLAQVTATLPLVCSSPTIWTYGARSSHGEPIEEAIQRQNFEPIPEAEQPPVNIEDCALYVYTSGTTGLPNATRISHGRVMQWSHWFAGMIDVQRWDRLYNCLPMFHSVGGIVAPGAMLVGKGSVVLQERFSASQFWDDVSRWECTLFQYIGELCRYLLHAQPSPGETKHQIRMTCGNGMRPDIWAAFQKRFAIPRIVEFYAATEGAVSLFNVEGEIGSIGRVPQFLASRFTTTLIRNCAETGDPVRNEQGFCIRCSPNEVGEAIGSLKDGLGNVANRFEGYVSSESSQRKILHNVFQPGDAWFRTGDLMRKDERGFYYFVDRIGDTFRWKGENVSCTEVANVLGAFRGVKHATVYGVNVACADGKAGMAAIVAEEEFDTQSLRAHLLQHLPGFACPVFLRLRDEIDVTTTFKYNKTNLVRQGFDPDITEDRILFFHSGREQYVPVDKDTFRNIHAGEVRL
jgi:fatty-acyl-CoA synthase